MATKMRGSKKMSRGPGKTTMKGTNRSFGSAAPGKTTMKGSKSNYGRDSSLSSGSNRKNLPGLLG